MMIFLLYLWAYVPVIIFSWAIQTELSKRPEFGQRPGILGQSVLVIAVSGLLSILVYTTKSIPEIDTPGLFKGTVAPFLLIALYLLEYSIHAQRIEKSFLEDDHKAAARPAVTQMMLLVLIAVLTAAAGLIALGGSNKLTDSAIKLLPSAASILLIIACGYISMRVFSFQKGLVRKKVYHIVTLLIAVILSHMPAVVISFIPVENFIALLYTAVLCVYVGRLYEEYVYFRFFHINDLMEKQELVTKSRNKLINKSIVSTVEEDISILEELLKDTMTRTVSELPLPQYKITGLALYRLNSGVFSVEAASMIQGYCPPLLKFDAIKKTNDEQIRKLMIDTVFHKEKILGGGPEAASSFAEEAVFRLLSEKEIIYLDPLPQSYKGVIKMMALYPIKNNDEITGFFVLVKDSFDKLFPQEINVLSDVNDSINTIFSIMYGKEVQEERNRLEGEMNIAKEIQTSIVPRSFDIKGYETACSMSTATEVGGDAYDVAVYETGNYFSIGDVSGHGLPSGIMALIQITAFQASLEASRVLDRELPIHELYDITNRILCTINRDRIGSDKFMTGNVFVEKDGIIQHAGTHEVALLYKRSEDNVLEIKETTDKTAFLGLSELVVSSQSTGSFQVESGDVLLLYTDGAIEAKNEMGEQYGIRRLADDLKAHIELPPKEIIAVLEEHIRGFAKKGDIKKYNGNMADDLSFVILKKE